MEIERKLSDPRGLRLGVARITGRSLGIRRSESDRKPSPGEKVVPTLHMPRKSGGMQLPGIVGTAIRGSQYDRRRKYVNSVGSQYIERIRTARSRRGSGDRASSSLLSAVGLQIVGMAVSVKPQKNVVKPKEVLPTPRPSDAELEEMIDRMKTRALEVEAVLRQDLSTGDGIRETKAVLDSSLAFIDEIQVLAGESEYLVGAIFQELLARHRATHETKQERKRGDEGEVDDALNASFRNMSVDRARDTGRVPLESLTDLLSIDRLVEAAHSLCKLVRVKIEDDNDLQLAATVVEDSAKFFADLDQLARWQHLEQMELLTELRKF